MASISFLYLLHPPINHQIFTMDNGLNTWAWLLHVIQEQPLCFSARDKNTLHISEMLQLKIVQKCTAFNLHSAPPSIGTFPILDRWGKEECLKNLHTAAKVCTCSQFPIPTISCCITISIPMTVLDLVVTVNKLVVTVLDLVMGLVVDTVIDSFVTVLDLLVKNNEIGTYCAWICSLYNWWHCNNSGLSVFCKVHAQRSDYCIHPHCKLAFLAMFGAQSSSLSKVWARCMATLMPSTMWLSKHTRIICSGPISASIVSTLSG